MKHTLFLTAMRIIAGLMLLLNPLFLWAGIIWWPETRFAAFCVIGLDVWGAAGILAMVYLFGTRAGRRQFSSMWRQKYHAKDSSASQPPSAGNGGDR